MRLRNSLLEPTVLEEASSKPEQRPSKETLEKLAYHEREPPRPAHANACDAR